jgi:hypothetical protein
MPKPEQPYEFSVAEYNRLAIYRAAVMAGYYNEGNLQLMLDLAALNPPSSIV